jgi:predicted ester cyclase
VQNNIETGGLMSTSDQRRSQEAANKAFFRRAFEEFFVQRNLESVDRNYATNYIQHNEMVAGWAAAQGFSPIEAVKQFFSGFFLAFPDFAPTIDHLYAEDDKVFAFVTWRGTHQGEFQGISPTGKQVVIQTAEIMRIENGQFAEHWDVVNDLGMLQTLGIATLRELPTH